MKFLMILFLLKLYTRINIFSNHVVTKLIENPKSKYFFLPGLSRKQMGLLKRKKEMFNVFYFLIKIPNLSLY